MELSWAKAFDIANLPRVSTIEQVARPMRPVAATVVKQIKSSTLQVGVANWPHHQQVLGGGYYTYILEGLQNPC